jgi:hypothetical protein
MSINRNPEAPGQGITAADSLGVLATFPRQSTSDYPNPPKSNRLDGVLPMTHEWLAGLPPDVRPIHLIEQYPRLVNLLALAWNNTPVATTLLTDLLNGDRSSWGGFPAAVSRELWALHDCYFKGPSLNEGTSGSRIQAMAVR